MIRAPAHPGVRRLARWAGAVLACVLAAALAAPAAGLGATRFGEPSPDLGPDDVPESITAGPDGAMWFTISEAHRIGRLTVDGVFTQYWAGGYHTGPAAQITTGPDGRLWFVEPSRNLIGRMDPVSKLVTEFPAGNARRADLWDIAPGPDGAMWFTDSQGDRIGRITTDGVLTQFPGRGTNPEQITAGADGRVWFTCEDGAAVCRMGATGAVRIFSIPFDPDAGRISSIATGPDGNVWVADQDHALWRIAPDGRLTAFRVPGPGGPTAVTSGPDGNLWFTYTKDLSRQWVGSMTLGGRMRFLRPVGQPSDGYAFPEYDISPGVDGGVWFTDQDWIGRITPDGRVGTYPATPVIRSLRQRAAAAVVLTHVECPPATVNPCYGSVNVTAVGPRRNIHAGRETFTVAPGGQALVPVPFTAGARGILARQGYLATYVGASGPRGPLVWLQKLALRVAGRAVPPPITTSFQSPTGNLACRIADDPWEGQVRCRSVDEPASVILRQFGTVRVCHALACGRDLRRVRRTVQYGRGVSTPRFACRVRRDGVRCVHRASGKSFLIDAHGVH